MIGFIVMGGSAAMETYWHRHLPEGEEAATTRVPFHRATYRGLMEMTDRVPEAARILAEARPGVIALSSFTGSCIRGNELVNMIQQATGIPAVVPALETVRYLRLIQAERIALVTGFEQELRMLERVFFTNHQIEIPQIVELPPFAGEDPYPISQVDYGLVLRRLRQADIRNVDAVVVDLPTFVIEGAVQDEVERLIQVPVLSMPQVLLWAALERTGASTEHLSLTKFLSKCSKEA